MDYHDIVIRSKIYNLFEKSYVNNSRGGIMRKGDNQHLRPGPHLFVCIAHIFKKVRIIPQGNALDLTAYNYHTVRMYRICRTRRHYHITRINCSKRKVRYALFGAYGNNNFILRVQINIVTAFIPVNHRSPEFGNTL